MGGWMDRRTPVWIMHIGLLSPPCNLLLRLVLVPAHSTHPLSRMLKGEPGSTGTTWLWLCGWGTATLSPDLAASLITENSSEHFPSFLCLAFNAASQWKAAGWLEPACSLAWRGDGPGSVPEGGFRAGHPPSPPTAPTGCKHNPALLACGFLGVAAPAWISSLVGA